MGFFKKRTLLFSPMAGRTVPLAEVGDPAFSGEMLGKGIAIVPEDGRVFSPCDAVVETVFPTGHALTLATPWGGEILIHVGLDTVTLAGRGFAPQVAPGDRVTRGQLLLEADLDAIRAGGLDPVTPVLLCNWQKFGKLMVLFKEKVTEKDTIMELCL